MKNGLLSLIVISVMTAGMSATADSLLLDNTQVENLTVDQSVLAVRVSYPGKNISGVCDLEITADSYGRNIPISELLEELEITSFFEPDQQRRVEIISRKTVRIPLVEHTYVDGVIISTKDGSTLKETIERTLGKNRRVVIMPRSC